MATTVLYYPPFQKQHHLPRVLVPSKRKTTANTSHQNRTPKLVALGNFVRICRSICIGQHRNMDQNQMVEGEKIMTNPKTRGLSQFYDMLKIHMQVKPSASLLPAPFVNGSYLSCKGAKHVFGSKMATGMWFFQHQRLPALSFYQSRDQNQTTDLQRLTCQHGDPKPRHSLTNNT